MGQIKNIKLHIVTDIKTSSLLVTAGSTKWRSILPPFSGQRRTKSIVPSTSKSVRVVMATSAHDSTTNRLSVKLCSSKTCSKTRRTKHKGLMESPQQLELEPTL